MVLAGDKAAFMKFEEDNSFRLIQIGGFKQWFANQQVLAGKRVMSKGEYWLNHPQRRQYEGIEFEPSGHGRAGYYNLWRGFSVQPKQGDCSIFLAHLRDNIRLVDFSYRRVEVVLNFGPRLLYLAHNVGTIAIVATMFADGTATVLFVKTSGSDYFRVDTFAQCICDECEQELVATGIISMPLTGTFILDIQAYG
jgi:hypothetical protein